jgi:hypothetical protein
MTPSKRWSEDPSGLSTFERRALEAGISVRRGSPAEIEVRSAAKLAIRNALLLKLPAAASVAASGAAGTSGAAETTAALGSGGAGSVAGTETAGLLGLAKPFGMGLLLGTVTMGALTGGQHLIASNSPPAPGRAPAPAISGAAPDAPAREHRVSTPAPALEAEEPRAAAPLARGDHGASAVRREVPRAEQPEGALDASTASYPTDSSVSSASGVAESRRMAEARALVRSNRPSEALRALDAIGRDFPNGVLTQEREALAIEALRALGNLTGARERADRFLERYPGSPHAASVRRARD